MAYHVIPMRIDEHRETLLRLWRENTYDPERNHFANERFRWLYENPEQPSRTWMAVDGDSHDVVGACSVFRSNKSVGGETLEAGVMNLFMVDPAHRTGAAALAIQRGLTIGSREAGLRMVIAKVGAKKPPIFERVGYRRVGSVQRWMLRMSDIAQTELQAVVDCKEETTGVADARFDALWQRASGRYQIVSEKTAPFLNWRYSGFSEQTRFYCQISPDDGRLLGFVVFYIVTNMAVVVDFFCEEPSGSLADRLLHGFVAKVKKEPLKWINLSYLGNPAFETSLRRVGFLPGEGSKDKKTLLVYLDSSLPPDICRGILRKDDWSFFGDETNILLSPSLWGNWRNRDGQLLPVAQSA